MYLFAHYSGELINGFVAMKRSFFMKADDLTYSQETTFIELIQGEKREAGSIFLLLPCFSQKL